MADQFNNKLDILWQLRKERNNMIIARDDEVSMVIPKEIQEQIDDIMDNYQQDIEKLNLVIAEAEEDIKSNALGIGESLHGEHLMAVYRKGATTWDTKGLEGYAVAQPQVLEFRKIGKPSVAIQERKQ